MKVFRRKMSNDTLSPTYYFRVMIAGKVIQQSTGEHDKRAAEKWARDHVDGLRGETQVEVLAAKVKTMISGGNDMKLADAWPKFLELAGGEKTTDKHRRQKQGCWDDFCAYLTAEHPSVTKVQGVTPEIAQEYIRRLRQTGKFEKTITFHHRYKRRNPSYESNIHNLSVRTCNFYLTALKQVFSVLGESLKMETSAFGKIKAEKQRESDTIMREAFTADHVALMEDKADEFIRGLVIVGLGTGLREGDICTLRWREVSLETGFVTRATRKTGKRIRVPMSKQLHEYLSGLPRDGEYVLPEHAAMYENNPYGVTYRFKLFLEKTCALDTTRQVKGRDRRVSVLDVHSLRHTFCWQCLKRGIPPVIVQGWLGHEDLKMTEHYSKHLEDIDSRQYRNRIPQLTAGGDAAESLTIDIAAEVQPVNTDADKLAQIHAAVSGKRGKLADTIRAILAEG